MSLDPEDLVATAKVAAINDEARLHVPFAPPAGEPDERAAWAESEFDLWADVNPAFAAVHELKAALPEECLWLFAPEFDSGLWATCTNVPSFLMAGAARSAAGRAGRRSAVPRPAARSA